MTNPEDVTYHPAFVRCQQLMDEKGQDYGGGQRQDDARVEYHPYGASSYMQMLHTKWTRINAITRKTEAGENPNFESLKDSVEDLINYAAFFWAFLDAEETTISSEDLDEHVSSEVEWHRQKIFTTIDEG